MVKALFSLSRQISLKYTDGELSLIYGPRMLHAEETIMVIYDTAEFSDLNKGRLRKQLNKQYRWSNGSVSTLQDHIESAGLTNKSAYVKTHTSKRIQLEYRELKNPVTYYTLWFDERGIGVPKLVYDSIVI